MTPIFADAPPIAADGLGAIESKLPSHRALAVRQDFRSWLPWQHDEPFGNRSAAIGGASAAIGVRFGTRPRAAKPKEKSS